MDGKEIHLNQVSLFKELIRLEGEKQTQILERDGEKLYKLVEVSKQRTMQLSELSDKSTEWKLHFNSKEKAEIKELALELQSLLSDNELLLKQSRDVLENTLTALRVNGPITYDKAGANPNVKEMPKGYVVNISR